MADEALEHADYVARGEGGEQLMLELIEALEGTARARRRSPASRSGATASVVHNALRERCADLDTLPFPDLDAHRRPRAAATTIPIMTSWGCPFACNFCSVTAMFGRKYRFRSAESVIAEIKEQAPGSASSSTTTTWPPTRSASRCCCR